WLTALLFAVLTYTAKYYYFYFTRPNPLPGPLPLPLIGNLYLSRSDMSMVFYKLQIKYGEFMEFYMGSQRKIWIGDPKLLKKIHNPSMKTNFPNRTDGPWLDEIGITNRGIGLNNNLEYWRSNRTVLTQGLMVPSFLKQYLKEQEK
ncbi:19969_t:CDS:2, partial [Racocetra fulgida]